MKQILDAFDSTAELTARKLTANLQRSAMDSGWDPQVASNLSVSYSGDKFDVVVPPEYDEAAWRFEYGDGNRRPTAVIRKLKFGNAESSTFLDMLGKAAK
jgi:hypothetical protein